MDVPAKLCSRARLLATGNARKNDRVDAFHVALAALRGERLAEVGEEEHAEVLRMLSERREDLIKERTRTLNRLHGLLRDLLPGGAPKNLSAEKAARVLRSVPRSVRPRGGPARTRRRLAADLLRDVRRLDRRLCELECRIREALKEASTGLTRMFGVGPILAAKIMGRVGNVARFTTKAHFASYPPTPVRRPSRPQAGRWFVTGSRERATESSTTPCT